MHVLLFLINFNNFKRFQKKVKVLPSRQIKYLLTSPRIQKFVMDAKKSTDISRERVRKVGILLKISVPEFQTRASEFQTRAF